MTTKYVKAINDACKASGIKLGDVLEVISEDHVRFNRCLYVFKEKPGVAINTLGFWGDNFIPVACPCEIKSCLKHRLGF